MGEVLPLARRRPAVVRVPAHVLELVAWRAGVAVEDLGLELRAEIRGRLWIGEKVQRTRVPARESSSG